MPLLPVSKIAIPPQSDDDIVIGKWRIQVWTKMIGRGAAKFTAVANHPQDEQIVVEGRLTRESAIDAVLKQMPTEQRHEEVSPQTQSP
jgi:transposase-like protein